MTWIDYAVPKEFVGRYLLDMFLYLLFIPMMFGGVDIYGFFILFFWVDFLCYVRIKRKL